MEVHRITDAPTPLAEDIAARSRNYMISMVIRTVCFVLAIVFTGWLRWAFFIASLVLPYIAVMLANEGKSRRSDDPLPPVIPVQRRISGSEGNDEQ